MARNSDYTSLRQLIASVGDASSGSFSLNANLVTAILKWSCPVDTIWCVEAVTSTFAVYDQLQCTIPGSFLSSGATGLEWSGGASLGVKLALDSLGTPKFVTQIVGDGTFMFSMPSSVYWISARYSIPILTIVLSNNGWNAPRVSMELVHPTGIGSQITNTELNIALASPTPDFGGIAKAASGGKFFNGVASSVAEFKEVLQRAIDSVNSGVTAVVECRIPGLEGKGPGA